MLAACGPAAAKAATGLYESIKEMTAAYDAAPSAPLAKPSTLARITRAILDSGKSLSGEVWYITDDDVRPLADGFKASQYRDHHITVENLEHMIRMGTLWIAGVRIEVANPQAKAMAAIAKTALANALDAAAGFVPMAGTRPALALSRETKRYGAEGCERIALRYGR